MPQLTAAESRGLQEKQPLVIRDIDLALSVMEKEQVVAMDLETTGLSPWLDKIAVVALNGQKSEASAVLHVKGKLPKRLVDFFNDPTKLFVGHNCQNYDLLFLAQAGVDPHAATWYDTLVGEGVCKMTDRRDVRFSLKASVLRNLGVNLDKDIDHAGWSRDELSDRQVEYVAGDVKYVHELRTAQYAKATEKGLLPALETEMRLVPVMVQMILNGMPIDTDRLRDHLATEEERSQEALYRLWDVFGPINPGSAPQVKAALQSAGLDIMSTSANTLKDLIASGADQAGLLADIVTARQGKKRTNMYDNAWVAKYVAPDGRIHPKYWTCVSADTLVQMPCDRSKYPQGIPITAVRPGQLVYSFDQDNKLCLRRVLRVEQTGRKKVYRITAQSRHNKYIRKDQPKPQLHVVQLKATADHLVRLHSGDWKRVDQLQRGDKLCCFPELVPGAWGGRIRFGLGRKQHHLPTHESAWVATQQEELEFLPEGYLVHHIDFNPLNNSPDNLEILSFGEHLRLHNSIRFEASNHDVMDVEELGIEEVWDMEIEDTHCFIADGIAVHNCSTDTGRMSSSDCNMQQWPVNMRWVIAAPPGFRLVMADYKAAEVVVAAALANDSALLAAIEAGGDLHRNVGSQVFEVTPEEITSEQRKLAKAMGFCLLFGGWYETFYQYAKLAGANITLDDARNIEQRYFLTYQGIAAMKAKAEYQSRRGGPVMMKLPTGLKRNLIPGPNGRVAKTKILNTAVQGTAAAGMKFALLEAYRRGIVQQGIGASCHDELAGAIPENVAKEVARELEESMVFGMKEAVARMHPGTRCPISVDVKIGDDWRKE